MKKHNGEKTERTKGLGRKLIVLFILCLALFSAYSVLGEPILRDMSLDYVKTSTGKELPISYESKGLLADYSTGETFSIAKADFDDAVAGTSKKPQIVQINKENKVELIYSPKMNVMIFNTESDGNVKFAIESKGDVVYETITLATDLKWNHILNKINLYGPLVLIVWLGIIVLYFISKKLFKMMIILDGKRIDKNRKAISDVKESYEKKSFDAMKKQMKELGENKTTLSDYRKNLTREQCIEYGIAECLARVDIEKLTSEEEEKRNAVLECSKPDKFMKNTEEMAKKDAKGNFKNLNEVKAEFNKKLVESVEMLREQEHMTVEYDELMERVDDYNKELKDLIQKIEQLLKEPITCDLVLKFGKYIGAKASHDNRRRQLFGQYKLDDVKVIVTGESTKLGELIDSKTNIAIKGFYDSVQDVRGLKAFSKNIFKIRDEGEDDFTETKEIVMYEGHSYCLDTVEGEIKIIVK